MLDPNADMIMFQTWGRKLYDSNEGVNNCYAEMQDNLRQGYEVYANAARPQGKVYIAPVGYAFKMYHDKLCNAPNSPPTCVGTGNTGQSQEIVRSSTL